MSSFTKPPKVVFLDLWGTLGRIYPERHFTREPIWDAAQVLHINGNLTVSETVLSEAQRKYYSLDAQFRDFCLTFNGSDLSGFLNEVEKRFDCQIESQKEAMLQIQAIVDSEVRTFALYSETLEVLEELKELGVRIALLSNSWRFSIDRLFNNGISKYFEQKIFSFDIGLAKPDPGIFLESCKLMNVAPEDCLYVGDNIHSDGACMEVGMEFVLVDREYRLQTNQAELTVVHDLKEFLDVLKQTLQVAS